MGFLTTDQRTLLLLCALGLAPFNNARAADVILHSFSGTDGASPEGGLVIDDSGDLYGTTVSGGGQKGCQNFGCGTVFALARDGTISILHSFVGGKKDGDMPLAKLTIDKAGALYGTTAARGGTVFEIAPDGTETIRYTFYRKDAAYGISPHAGVVLDDAGNLFGTTLLGGDPKCGSKKYYCGTAFELESDGTLNTIHSFSGGRDGAYPDADLVLDKAGNLYGETEEGGGTGCEQFGSDGCGAIFKISPDGKETILYAFKGGDDGANPDGGLTTDAAGDFLGTTAAGGGYGYDGNGGTVFKLAPDGTETILYAFKAGNDGAGPSAGLVSDKAGNVYGTTFGGGGDGCNGTGCGTVFKIAPDGTETLLHAFQGGSDGALPSSSLILAKGILYGVTTGGGTYGDGTVFKIKS